MRGRCEERTVIMTRRKRKGRNKKKKVETKNEIERKGKKGRNI